MPEYLGAMITGAVLLFQALTFAVEKWESPKLAAPASLAANTSVRATYPTNALAVSQKEIIEP